VLAVSTRYARNEALAVAEYSLLDIGAWVRFARETLGYRQVNLLGWSGGGTQSAFTRNRRPGRRSRQHPTAPVSISQPPDSNPPMVSSSWERMSRVPGCSPT
jgi:poly(3-hydroxyalkanoate) synthetase